MLLNDQLRLQQFSTSHWVGGNTVDETRLKVIFFFSKQKKKVSVERGGQVWPTQIALKIFQFFLVFIFRGNKRSHTKKKESMHTGNLVQVNCLFIIIASVVVVVAVQHSLLNILVVRALLIIKKNRFPLSTKFLVWVVCYISSVSPPPLFLVSKANYLICFGCKGAFFF